MKHKCFLVDMDGTLSDASARLHYLKPEDGSKKDFRKFMSEMENDPPHAEVVDLIESQREELKIIIVTARGSEYFGKTEAWLKKYDIRYDGIYMREHKDNRPDYIVKEELLDRIIADDYVPVLAIDDKDSVIEMYRRRGLLTFDANIFLNRIS